MLRRHVGLPVPSGSQQPPFWSITQAPWQLGSSVRKAEMASSPKSGLPTTGRPRTEGFKQTSGQKSRLPVSTRSPLGGFKPATVQQFTANEPGFSGSGWGRSSEMPLGSSERMEGRFSFPTPTSTSLSCIKANLNSWICKIWP